MSFLHVGLAITCIIVLIDTYSRTIDSTGGASGVNLGSTIFKNWCNRNLGARGHARVRGHAAVLGRAGAEGRDIFFLKYKKNNLGSTLASRTGHEVNEAGT